MVRETKVAYTLRPAKAHKMETCDRLAPHTTKRAALCYSHSHLPTYVELAIVTDINHFYLYEKKKINYFLDGIISAKRHLFTTDKKSHT